MSVQILIENALYHASQLFLLPVLLLVIALAVYSFYALGVFTRQAMQRRSGDARGFDLLATWRNDHALSPTALETIAFKRLEGARLATRIAPMLGLVATMIPMGPALKSLADGKLEAVSANLTVAFSAVILALIAASITYFTVNVRRRWYAEELMMIEKERLAPANQTEMSDAAHGLAQEAAE